MTTECGFREPTLKIQIGVMRRRRGAGKQVREQGPEARARFHARIPELGVLMLAPRHVADIIDDREMRGGGDIGQREAFTREPVSSQAEPADVVEMGMNVRAAGAKSE